MKGNPIGAKDCKLETRICCSAWHGAAPLQVANVEMTMVQNNAGEGGFPRPGTWKDGVLL